MKDKVRGKETRGSNKKARSCGSMFEERKRAGRRR